MDAKLMLKQLDAALNQLALLRQIIEAGEVQIPPSVAIEAAAGICHKCKEQLGTETPVRGCHRRCSQEMNRAIKAGEATEAKLMAAGLLGPAGPPGRKKKTQFQELLAGVEADATQKTDAAQKRAAQKQNRNRGSSSR